MQTKHQNSERGQAIVLIVLAMIVLLGFTALAVDGSMVYSDRRMVQNAADASALAGGATAAQQLENAGIDVGTWTASPPNCDGNVAAAASAGRTAAANRALDNDFNIPANGITEGLGGVETTCGQENITVPLVTGGSSTVFTEKFMDLKTSITNRTDTAFAQVLFPNGLENTVQATTRIRPRQSLAYGYAILALNPSPCKGNVFGVIYNGLGGNSNNLTVTDGGIWSNGCMVVNGNPRITVQNAGVWYFFTENNSDLDDIVFDPATRQAEQVVNNNAYRVPASTYDIVPPDCSGHEVSADYIINYYRQNNTPLPAGLYCVNENLRINAGDRVEGYGVTLVLNGELRINGDATVRLTAPTRNYVGPAIPGLLIYAPRTNPGPFIINGGSDHQYVGTILAPGARITFNGDAMTEAFHSQIIGWDVTIGGSSSTHVVFNSNEQMVRPTYLNLEK
jgi:Tfp pilus assembly protein PilX